jgi:hypothetical protein
MTTSEKDLFEQMATRGTPRGAALVLETARSRSEDDYVRPPDDLDRPHRSRKLVLAGLAATMVLALVATVATWPRASHQATTTVPSSENDARAALDQAYRAATSGNHGELCQLSSSPNICASLLGLGALTPPPSTKPTVLDGHELPAVNQPGLSFPGGYVLKICGQLADGSIYASDFVALNNHGGVMGELYWTDYRLTNPLGSGGGTAIPTPTEVNQCRGAL